MKSFVPSTIGIIGGRGKMGRLFARFFRQLGYKVLISGRKTKLTNKELVQKADVIIFSVPIQVTPQVIKEVLPYVKPGALLTDLTSVKEAPVKAMAKAPVSVKVVGMHPVFGPSISSLKNQVVVLCPARGKKGVSWLKKTLASQGAKVIVTTPRAHDEVMAIVQGLIHLQLIGTGLALKKLGAKPQRMGQYSSPMFKLLMIMAGRVLSQDSQLYAQIATTNPKIKKVSQTYLEAIKKLDQAIGTKDADHFAAYFKQAASWLGDFKSKAAKQSHKLVKNLPAD